MKAFVAAALFLLATALAAAPASPPVTLAFDPKTTYQTWEAWGGTAPLINVPFAKWREDYDRVGVNRDLPMKLLGRVWDELVFDIGLTRVRLEVGPQVEMVNDNDDPNVTNEKAFRFLWQDFVVETQILPLKQRIESRGNRLVLYISYDLDSNGTPPFLLKPEEYAEMAVTFLRHLKARYGLEPDYWSVLNEPANHRPGNPVLCAQLTAATGARIAAAGFKTKMSGPECVNIEEVPVFMRAMERTPGAFDHFAQITYHLYFGGHLQVKQRNDVRDWAQKLKVTSAQTEWMDAKDLDLAQHAALCITQANVVAWERYGLFGFHRTAAGAGLFPGATDDTKIVKTPSAWYLGQLSHYIRPGAVRVRLDSPAAEILPVAFLSPGKRRPVLVLLNLTGPARDVIVTGLPAGAYARSHTCEGEYGRELPPVEVGADGRLSAMLPARSVTTLTADPPAPVPGR